MSKNRRTNQPHGGNFLSPREGWARRILVDVARETGIDLDMAMRGVRSRSAVAARRVLAIALRQRGYALKEIAYILGYRDHTTVHYLIKPLKSPTLQKSIENATRAPAEEVPPPEPLKFKPCRLPVPSQRLG